MDASREPEQEGQVMTIVERYQARTWVVVGRGRSVGGVLRRVYGRRYGYQPDSGVPRHGLLIRNLPANGATWQASVEGRIRWTEEEG